MDGSVSRAELDENRLTKMINNSTSPISSTTLSSITQHILRTATSAILSENEILGEQEETSRWVLLRPIFSVKYYFNGQFLRLFSVDFARRGSRK